MSMERYDAERVAGAKTLGAVYEHYERDPAAFIAGTQYALDKLMQEENFVIGAYRLKMMSKEFAVVLAINVLRRVKNGSL